MRVAIIENTRYSDPGQVGVALAEAGARVEVIRAYAGEPLPSSIDDHDALIVFGGEQNARDDEKHPYLPALAEVMRGYGEAGRAVLGICLGSQLLARAFGGGEPDRGSARIRLAGDRADRGRPCRSGAVGGQRQPVSLLPMA